jgi:hypothetical protein
VLIEFLVQSGYVRGGVDKALFVKKKRSKSYMIAQIYVDDIVFGGMSAKMVDLLVQKMQAEFKMSMIGKLKFFLGFQIKKIDDDIFISLSKYAKKHCEKFWSS